MTFVDASGRPLPPGVTGQLAGNDESFVVGYDGQAYVTDLLSANQVSIALADGRTCHATFPYRQRPGEQVQIDSVVCR